jgi:hypothetical protein
VDTALDVGDGSQRRLGLLLGRLIVVRAVAVIDGRVHVRPEGPRTAAAKARKHPVEHGACTMESSGSQEARAHQPRLQQL